MDQWNHAAPALFEKTLPCLFLICANLRNLRLIGFLRPSASFAASIFPSSSGSEKPFTSMAAFEILECASLLTFCQKQMGEV
jgi:hypothetical protein